MEDFTREELLSYTDSLPLSEYAPLLIYDIFCTVLINPWDKRIIFSDRMKEILGPIASQDMLLSAYYDFIPENERDDMIKKYEANISELLTEQLERTTISHSLTGNGIDTIFINIDMRVIYIDKTRFILGIISDKSPSVEHKSQQQFFGEGINAYLFTYDVVEDTCYMSNKFVEDFDLRSNIMKNFRNEYAKYVHPDDVDKLVSNFNSFVSDHETDTSMTVRFIAPGRGEIYLRTDGFSDAGSDGILGSQSRFVSGIFCDVTDFMRDSFLRNNLIESSSAATFYADINAEKIFFSENIRDMIPNAPTEIEGDFIEIIAESIVQEDKKRFKNILHRAASEMNTKFAIEIRVNVGNDKVVWLACRGKSYEDSSSKIKTIVGSVFDLTQMNEVKENVEKSLASNEVTGLPGRDRLVNDTEKLLRRRELLSAALILIDIREFHSFNDRYGRSAGNEILIALSSLLKNIMPQGASNYHMGTDTFAVLWPDASQIKVTEYMDNILECVSQPLETAQGSFFVNIGIAASFYPLSNNADELLTNAEIALHKVKQDKKLKYSIYSPIDMNELKERLDFETQISQCIRNNMENFQLYYQPLINAHTGELAGAEALLRWQSPGGELVNPEKVVAALESTDQMDIVGTWILNEAVKQIAKWRSKGAPNDFYVHVNATADDLIRKDYVKDVCDTLDRYNVPPENILIELTETSLMKNMALCRKNLYDLNKNNIRTALDDFGSGYSSFNYLKELPVDEIKIDKTFVDDMETVEFNRAFISAITELAHSIGKHVVVEGVENEHQATAIKEMGADVFQGYYFGKPMSVFAFWNQYFS